MVEEQNEGLIRFKIIDYEVLESTNDKALEIVRRSESNENIVVVAKYQTNGKGQKGNKWEGLNAENLTFTIIIYPEFPDAVDQFYLNEAVSLSIKD